MKNTNVKKVEWDETLSVGIGSMDSQHQTLFRMINDLYTGCLYCSQIADASFKACMHNFLNCINSHSIAEENFLAEIQYPYLENHRRRHHNLIQSLLNQTRKFDTGSRRVKGFIRFLQNEVLTHVAVTDKKYAAFARQNL